MIILFCKVKIDWLHSNRNPDPKVEDPLSMSKAEANNTEIEQKTPSGKFQSRDRPIQSFQSIFSHFIGLKIACWESKQSQNPITQLGVLFKPKKEKETSKEK